MRICGVVSSSAADRSTAIGELAGRWGEIAVRSPPIPFDVGGYYATEMGGDLHQELIALGTPRPPDDLADWKHQTNAIEGNLARSIDDARRPRPVNLDCGYLTEAKFVLATTKNRSHRIYIGRGMFAEITLTFVAGRWTPSSWTYPNYRHPDVARFAAETRRTLRSHLGRRVD